MKFKLEICVDSVQSAIDAQQAGASRVELCDNLFEGGTTPSYGTILLARKYLQIGLNVLVRPRAGDFLYTDLEFDIMKRDIEMCSRCGADGIVIGMLNSDGTIDRERCAELVRLAHPMSVTFHRAFDMCLDPVKALQDIIESGADRLLSSGQKNSAEEGSYLLRDLVELAGERIVIMPGSGINVSNIASIAGITLAKEYHLSARKLIESSMVYRKEGLTMGNTPGYNEFTRKVADQDKIKEIISILKNL
ncbi:MAG: copper homeostasis protein CutC [Bacteroidales bacterium]|nr:copper homeostasis protein CutC [Bacteroidales bacterium]